MSELYECTSCGVVTSHREDVCSPQEMKNWNVCCGESAATIETMCEPMRDSLQYECSSCGRPTADPGLVCTPAKKR